MAPFTPKPTDKPSYLADIISFIQGGVELTECELNLLGEIALTSGSNPDNPDTLSMLMHVSDSEGQPDALHTLSEGGPVIVPGLSEALV
jgi:hypothetical protein